MIPMTGNRAEPYEDELSAVEVALTSLETQISTVNDTIAALELSNTNNVNIAFSGSAIFDDLLDPGVLVVANSNPPREVITGKSVIRRTTDNHVEVVDFTMVNGDADLVLFNNGGDIAHLIFNNGLVQIKHTVVANNLSLQATLLFYTQPAMGTGIVGPAGGDGIDGADGEAWGAWNNVTLAAGTQSYDTSPSPRYRLSNSNAQLQMYIGPTASWTSPQTVATLPSGARPSSPIRTMSWMAPSGAFATGSPVYVTISPSGGVTVYKSSSSEYIFINLIFDI